MANEKRLIDANVFNSVIEFVQKYLVSGDSQFLQGYEAGLRCAVNAINELPTVDAVEVADPELLKAIKLLIKQYAHSKASDYVHNPVAHALYHTWKQVDKGR